MSLRAHKPGEQPLPLYGIDEISLPKNAVLIFSHPAVKKGNHPKPLYIYSGATAIQWAYHLNQQTTPTIGGEVVQVLSCSAGPINITGNTAGLSVVKDRSLPDGYHTYGYQAGDFRHAQGNYTPHAELKEIVEWFRTYMEVAGTATRGRLHRDERAIDFKYPERGWHFLIQVTNISGFRYDQKVISPEWSIEAEIVSDNALDFFQGTTMTSFTDDLITSPGQLGTIGLSSFADSDTERSNGAFGATGGAGSTDPFVNPQYHYDSNAGTTFGENFQRLVASWSSGGYDFNRGVFGSLLDAGANPQQVDQIYQSLFGSSFIGTPGAGTGSGVGVSVSGTTGQAALAAGANADWITALLQQGNFQTTVENKNFLYSWWQSEGGGGKDQGGQNNAEFNWLNTTLGSQYPSINSVGVRSYPDFATGITQTLNSLPSSIRKALLTGDPYSDAIDASDGLQTWLGGSNHTSATLAYAEQVLGRYAGTVLAGAAATVSTAGKPTGDLTSLASKLLAYHGTKWRDDNGNGLAQIQATANGQKVSSQNASVGSCFLDARTIATVLWLIESGFTIGTYAWCSDHHDDGADGHAGGKAVDISSINGVAINSDGAGPLTVSVATLLNGKSPNPIRQLISAGWGGTEEQQCLSLCIPSSGFYGEPTLSEHTNHIHVGF